MSYIGQAPGLGQRTAFRFVATMGQTKFTGLDATGYPLGYTPGLIDVFVNGRLLSEPDYTASDGSTLIIAAPLDLGTEVRVLAQAPFSPANTYTMAQADAQFSRRRNRIIDPGMRVSQEQGNNLLTLAGGAALYPSDSIFAGRNGSTGSGTVQRIALTTPGGSPYRIRATVTAANPSPGSGDNMFLLTRLEGLDVADLKFGSDAAHTIGVRFGCRSSVAGTFPITIRNGSYTRSWIGSVTIAPAEAGTDVVKTLIIPGDQTGTWATDNTFALDLVFGLCAGSSANGVPGWQAGNYYGLASGTNLMATNGATFDLFDVGLYDLTGLQQGVFPPFELDSFERDLAKCHRYFYKCYNNNFLVRVYNVGSGAVTMMVNDVLPQPMRYQPSISGVTFDIGDAAERTDHNGAGTTDERHFFVVVTPVAGNAWVDLHGYTANARL